jgi:hypothetical protein
MEVRMTEVKYMDGKETGVLIRKVLKREFPETKFSVRLSTYSGGSSITAYWTDGPTEPEVNNWISAFAGNGFDGMIDLEYSKTSWLRPDGTVGYLKSEGTEGSMGSVPGYDEELPPGAEPVRFLVSYVFTSRTISNELTTRMGERVIKEYGLDPDLYPMEIVDGYSGKYVRLADRWSPELNNYFEFFVSKELFKTDLRNRCLSERSLLERVSEGEGVEDWEERAKSGEVMRII